MDYQKYVFVIQLVTTLYMVGLIWFVQIVHYPLFAKVGEPFFVEYEKHHVVRTSFVVLGPMLIELGCSLLLFWVKPQWLTSWQLWGSVTLVGIIWLSTFLLQVPNHNILEKRFDAKAQKTLVLTNWIRTFGWSAHGGILIYGLIRLLENTARGF